MDGAIILFDQVHRSPIRYTRQVTLKVAKAEDIGYLAPGSAENRQIIDMDSQENQPSP